MSVTLLAGRALDACWQAWQLKSSSVPTHSKQGPLACPLHAGPLLTSVAVAAGAAGCVTLISTPRAHHLLAALQAQQKTLPWTPSQQAEAVLCPASRHCWQQWAAPQHANSRKGPVRCSEPPLTRPALSATAGAAGGIGQPLSLLIKLNPLVGELRLYDVVGTPGVAADVGHMDTDVRVTSALGQEQLGNALYGSDLVIIPAGVPRKPGMTRDDLFNINAGGLPAAAGCSQGRLQAEGWAAWQWCGLGHAGCRGRGQANRQAAACLDWCHCPAMQAS